VEENLAAVFAIRDLVCPKLTKGGKINLLGKIGSELTETYQLAVRKGKITARDVMVIAPDVGISAISNRLAKLQTLGLLLRTKEGAPGSGGRQFIYQAVC
jgi:predicted transcriptional regulator